MVPDELSVARTGRPRRGFAFAMVAGVLVAVTGALLLYGLRSLAEPTGRSPLSVLALVLLGGGMAIFGIALGVVVLAPGFGDKARAWQGVGSHRLVLATTLLVIVLSNLWPLVVTIVNPGQGICTASGFVMAAASVSLALVGVTYLRFIRPGVITLDDLGLRSRGLPGHVVRGLLVGVIAILASAAIQATLDRLGVRQTQLQDFRCIKAFPIEGFIAVVLAGGVAAPIAEELYFRGYVFHSYLRFRGPLIAYVASSLVFALLHLNLPAMLPIFLLGVLFCVAFQRTGSLVPSMVGHVVNNSVAFVILYFGDVVK